MKTIQINGPDFKERNNLVKYTKENKTNLLLMEVGNIKITEHLLGMQVEVVTVEQD